MYLELSQKRQKQRDKEEWKTIKCQQIKMDTPYHNSIRKLKLLKSLDILNNFYLLIVTELNTLILSLNQLLL